MSLTQKLSLAMLVVALGAGVTACNKKEPVTGEPSAAEQLGTSAGEAQQSTSEVLDGASEKLDAAAADAKQSAEESKADFKKGYEEGKQP